MFPVVASAASTVSSANSTSFSVTMPSGITAGNLLVAFVTTDGEAWFSAITSGWSVTARPNSIAVHSMALWKIAEGSDTLSLSISASESWVARVFRITNHDPTRDPAIRVAAATSAAQNPPSLTAPWGSTDNLWLVYVGLDGNSSCSGYPSRYENTGTDTSTEATTTNRVGQGYATRNYAGATEDPGTFTNTNEPGVVWTVAVAPATFTQEKIRRQTQGHVSAKGTSKTQAVTLAAGNNRRMFVALSALDDYGVGVTTVTFGGSNLTKVTDGSVTAEYDLGTNLGKVQWWQLQNENMPANGSQNLIVTLDVNINFVFYWAIYEGVNQEINVRDVTVDGSVLEDYSIGASVTAADGDLILGANFRTNGSTGGNNITESNQTLVSDTLNEEIYRSGNIIIPSLDAPALLVSSRSNDVEAGDNTITFNNNVYSNTNRIIVVFSVAAAPTIPSRNSAILSATF